MEIIFNIDTLSKLYPEAFAGLKEEYRKDILEFWIDEDGELYCKPLESSELGVWFAHWNQDRWSSYKLRETNAA